MTSYSVLGIDPWGSHDTNGLHHDRVDVLDETQGEIAYVFQETVPAGDQGWVDIDGTLLARLKQRKSPLAVVQRSGSI